MMNDFDLENWHDYEISSRREIIALLRNISAKKRLIRMLIDDETDVCITSILAVDPDTNTVTLGPASNGDQNLRILAAKRIAFETTLDKIRILFASESVTETIFAKRPALRMAVPATLVRLQRREYYRMATPISNPVRVTIPLPEDSGGGSAILVLADISYGGISVLDNKFILGNTVGTNYPGCYLELPEVGTVMTTLQVRNSFDLTLLNNKPNRRLGCHFIDISRGSLAMVQRYLTKLERKRNARIAGIG